MRIAVIPERYGNVVSPCASIRIGRFLDAVRVVRPQWSVRYLLPEELAAWKANVVIWHRASVASEAAVSELAAIARQGGARTIYDLDDNLLDLETHSEADAYAAAVAAVRRSLRVADRIWVSTARLAERSRQAGALQTKVLPNALDPHLWGAGPSPRRKARGALRVLYMGTRTHDADFQLLKDAMDCSRAAKDGNVRVSLVGVRASAAAIPSWAHEIAVPSHVGASYPAFVHWLTGQAGFSLGVAPLVSGAFNECKSPIKVLDYAALGLPTMASKVPTYVDNLSPGDCMFIDNDPEAWGAAFDAASEQDFPLQVQLESVTTRIGHAAFLEAVMSRVAAIEELVA